MRTVHHDHRLGRQELEAIVAGSKRMTIDDMEFLETLAQKRCMLMPPWVFHIGDGGRLEKLTPVRYDENFNLDKPRMLLDVMRKLPAVIH